MSGRFVVADLDDVRIWGCLDCCLLAVIIWYCLFIYGVLVNVYSGYVSWCFEWIVELALVGWCWFVYLGLVCCLCLVWDFELFDALFGVCNVVIVC